MSTSTTAVSDLAAGHTPSAAEVAAITDMLQALSDAWTSYTPTFGAGGGSPVVGNGTLTGRYYQAGKKVGFETFMTCGSTTNYGSGFLTLTLPVAIRSGARRLFLGNLYDTSAGDSYVVYGLVTSASSTLNLRVPAAPVVGLSGTSLFTFATGDQIAIAGEYEVA